MNKLTRQVAGLIMLLGSTLLGSTPMLASASKVRVEVCHNEDNAKVLADIKDRLTAMNGLVRMKYTPEVMSYIMGYLRYKEGTSAVLGRQATYFPIFEDVLTKNNLPTDLKYLSVVESSLRPNAFSRVGAAGLWQFMRGTGRMMGLKINRTIDERRSPYKSTEAAAAYLGMLYEEFNDWELALAAYNSGPGRVRRAIAKGGSRDFWEIRKFLPKETRNYVPAFIAVNYLAQYYYLHDIQPTLEHPDLMTVTNVTLYEEMSFSRISDITGASTEIIRALNPCFLRGYVPKSVTGSYILLPNYAATLLLHHLYTPDSPELSMHEILADNTWLTLGELRLLRSTIPITEHLPLVIPHRLDQQQPSDLTFALRGRNEQDAIWYRLKKRESLAQIARKKKISLSKLLQLNETIGTDLMPGSLVRLQ